jgi:hypothetical protein
MESVGLQYGGDEFVAEGPVDANRYATSKNSGTVYAPENFYDAASGSWYSSGNYTQNSATQGSYHNVNHTTHMSQQGPHEHYMSPHVMDSPQPLPPMSSFRGNSSNGPAVPPPSNPALYNPTLNHQHNLQNDTLVGKALQTVSNFVL